MADTAGEETQMCRYIASVKEACNRVDQALQEQRATTAALQKEMVRLKKSEKKFRGGQCNRRPN